MQADNAKRVEMAALESCLIGMGLEYREATNSAGFISMTVAVRGVLAGVLIRTRTGKWRQVLGTVEYDTMLAACLDSFAPVKALKMEFEHGRAN